MLVRVYAQDSSDRGLLSVTVQLAALFIWKSRGGYISEVTQVLSHAILPLGSQPGLFPFEEYEFSYWCMFRVCIFFFWALKKNKHKTYTLLWLCYWSSVCGLILQVKKAWLTTKGENSLAEDLCDYCIRAVNYIIWDCLTSSYVFNLVTLFAFNFVASLKWLLKSLVGWSGFLEYRNRKDTITAGNRITPYYRLTML